MTWERRNLRETRPYYYRARRVDGKVLKEYFGRGEKAAAAAAADAKALAERKLHRDRIKQLERVIIPLEKRLRELDEAVILLAHAVLLSAGFHQVNYQWRLHRD